MKFVLLYVSETWRLTSSVRFCGRALKWRRSGYGRVGCLSVMLLNSALHWSPSLTDVNFTAFTWNSVNHASHLDPHCYTRRVKEAIHIRLYLSKISRDSGIEIPEAWMPTVKKHNSRRAIRQRTAKGTNRRNSEDRNALIAAVENQPISAELRAL